MCLIEFEETMQDGDNYNPDRYYISPIQKFAGTYGFKSIFIEAPRHQETFVRRGYVNESNRLMIRHIISDLLKFGRIDGKRVYGSDILVVTDSSGNLHFKNTFSF